MPKRILPHRDAAARRPARPSGRSTRVEKESAWVVPPERRLFRNVNLGRHYIRWRGTADSLELFYVLKGRAGGRAFVEFLSYFGADKSDGFEDLEGYYVSEALVYRHASYESEDWRKAANELRRLQA